MENNNKNIISIVLSILLVISLGFNIYLVGERNGSYVDRGEMQEMGNNRRGEMSPPNEMNRNESNTSQEEGTIPQEPTNKKNNSKETNNEKSTESDNTKSGESTPVEQ